MKHIIFVLLFSLPGLAQASFDINCIDNDCWNVGWTTFHNETGQRTEVKCVGGSCSENGWIQRANGRFLSEVSCMQGGCWTSGFHIFDREGRRLNEFVCEEDPNLGPNCLTAGWIIYDANGRYFGNATCVAGDCERYGWDVEGRNGELQIIRCKEESCFTYGWTLRP